MFPVGEEYYPEDEAFAIQGKEMVYYNGRSATELELSGVISTYVNEEGVTLIGGFKQDKDDLFNMIDSIAVFKPADRDTTFIMDLAVFFKFAHPNGFTKDVYIDFRGQHRFGKSPYLIDKISGIVVSLPLISYEEGVLSHGNHAEQLIELLSGCVDKILNGAKPGTSFTGNIVVHHLDEDEPETLLVNNGENLVVDLENTKVYRDTSKIDNKFVVLREGVPYLIDYDSGIGFYTLVRTLGKLVKHQNAFNTFSKEQ